MGTHNYYLHYLCVQRKYRYETGFYNYFKYSSFINVHCQTQQQEIFLHTLVWIQMTEVPGSMYFFLGRFIWNLFGCIAPTDCQPPSTILLLLLLFKRGFTFLPKPGVDKRLLGPTDEGGLLIIGGSGPGPLVICQ